jgi:hypothetical protein
MFVDDVEHRAEVAAQFCGRRRGSDLKGARMNGYSVQHKGGRWYVVFTHGGKQIWRTTHMADKAAASRVAPLIREAWIAEHYRQLIAPPVPKVPDPSTIGDICAAYRAANKRCNGDVERRNLLRFRGMVREIVGCSAGLEDRQSSAILTRSSAERWQARRQGLDGDVPDLSTRRPGNRTINSAWAAISGVFSRTVRASAGWRALVLPPTLEEFLATPRLPVPREGWKPWPRDAYERMRLAGDRIADPEMRMAHLLLRSLGLRTGELKAATADWIVPMSGGRWGLAVQDYPGQTPHPFQVKGSSARLLPLPAEVVAECLARREQGGYLIRGVREYRVFRGKVQMHMPLIDEEHVTWLRGFCPAGCRKPNHELRKWVGAIVYTRQGAEAARKFLGHSDTKTLVEHYSDYLGALDVETLWQEVVA